MTTFICDDVNPKRLYVFDSLKKIYKKIRKLVQMRTDVETFYRYIKDLDGNTNEKRVHQSGILLT